MSRPVIDPPEDVTSMNELTRDALRRVLICLGSYLVAFVLVCWPIPRGWDQHSLAGDLLQVLSTVWFVISHDSQEEWLRAYVYVAAVSALAMAQPVLIAQILGLVIALGNARGRFRRWGTAIGLTVAFVFGAAFAFIIVVPILAAHVSWNHDLNHWRYRMSMTSLGILGLHLVCLSGVAVQLPFWVRTLGGMEVVGMERLTKLRPYALLVAVILAALATPTPDILTMLVVAAPLYLFYEAGLLLARLFPTRA
ncbi:MAG: twin-arginine translocase subunit TatC [Chloroflexi bacterium]|nr:twin-arginine translocase subunit TatC [Chloroflexota bacterium]